MQYPSLSNNFNKNDQNSDRENPFSFNIIQIKKSSKDVLKGA